MGKGRLRCCLCNKINKKKNIKRNFIKCRVCNKSLNHYNIRQTICRACHYTINSAWNKGVKGSVPWNKGKSAFVDRESYRIHKNKQRKIKRDGESIDKKMPDRIRTLIRNQIRRHCNRKKNTKTEILLGCSANSFREYIEGMFEDGMSWSNYGNGHGKWNIDHVYPISRFNLSDIEEQKRAFNFTNCRPMWAIDNIKKGNHLFYVPSAAMISNAAIHM
jgi:hypothetical protein